MKVLKRYLRGIVFAAVVFVMFLWEKQNTVAADPEQSPDEVSIDIVHEHDDEACSTQVWIPCGGSWRNDHHGSHRIHYCTNQKSDEVVNGHVLADVHGCDWYWGYATEDHHDGEYVTEFDCDLSTIGSFKIKRTEDEDGIHLTAYTTVTDANLGDYTISWDDGTTGEVNSFVTIDVDTRRTYTATLNWHDVKRNADFRNELSYTDISLPCTCTFVSDDEVEDEKKLGCGEKPETVTVPEKRGYVFEGYYRDEIQWVGPDGAPTSDFNITQSDYDILLTAEWSPKTYDVEIGNKTFTFIYDEPYEDIVPEELELKKEGYKFKGIFAGTEKIFNEDGTAAGDGIWKWDISGEVLPDAEWEKLPEPTPEAGEENEDEDEKKDRKDRHKENSESPITDIEEKSLSSDEAVADEPAETEDLSTDEEFTEADIEEQEAEDRTAADRTPVTEDAAGDDDSLSELMEVALFYAENNDPPADGIINDERTEETTEEVQIQTPDSGMEKNNVPGIWIRKVAKFAAVTCGVAGGGIAAVYAIHAGFVYIFGMASVFNILPDGRKKNLGKLTVGNTPGGDIEIKIPQNFIDSCSTGNMEILLPGIFVRNRNKKQLVVVVKDRKYLKNIKKYVELKLFA